MWNWTLELFDNSDNCSINEQIAECLAKNDYMTVLSGAQMVTSVVAIILILALRQAEGGQVALHRNAKFLLKNHFITALLHCVIVFATHLCDVSKLVMYNMNMSPSNLMISNTRCLLERIPLTTTFAAIIVTLGMIALERIGATIDYRTYENTGGFLGYLLVIAQWIIVLGGMVIFLFNSDAINEGDRATCLLTTSENSLRASLLMLTVAIAEIAALITFYYLLYLNQKKKLSAKSSALTEKYQLDENIRATKLMIPLVWTHFLCLFPPMCLFAIYLNINQNIDQYTFTIFEQLSDWTPWYCLILPIVLFWRQKALRDNLRKKLHDMGLNKVNPSESRSVRLEQEQARHFELLNKMWDSGRHI